MIDVIIPVYNGERYLAEAIDSVLNQTSRQDICLKIVDDGSSDRTPHIIASYGNALQSVRQDNSGTGVARNTGLSLSNSEFVAFLDADDLWLPDKIETQMAALSADSALEAVYGQGIQFLSPELDPIKYKNLLVLSTPHDTQITSTILIRRVAHERIGPYSTVSLGENIDWQLRARDKKLKYTILPTVMYHRRIHPYSSTGAKNLDRTVYAKILKRSLDRRRKNDS